MLGRIKVVDFELADKPTDIDGLEGYRAVRGLVRLHGAPIGAVDVPIVNGRCAADAAREAILEQLNWPIVRQHLCYMLAGSAQTGPWSIDGLLDAPPPSRSGTLPSVTVAVCTRDRTADLERCLDALGRLDYPDLEILVIDNAPGDDATERLVRTNFTNVRYVREPRPGLDWARNRAIVEARGDIIAYTDDDVVVDAGWVTALAAVFAENPHVMAVTGLVVPYELETWPQMLFELYGGFGRGFERRWYGVNLAGGERAATDHGGAGKFGTGANMAYRRRVFDEIGYFDPALDVGTVTSGGGDLEMFFRVLKHGHVLVYEPNAVVRHRHRRDYPQFRTQIANNGVGFYSYLVRSAMFYPEERTQLLRLAVWWFWYWSIRRLLRSLVHTQRIPRDIILAELWGSLVGLFRYQRARQAAARLEMDRSVHAGAVAHVPAAIPTPRSQAVAVREVDLEQPLRPFVDVADYPEVRFFIFRGGRALGRVSIANRYQPVGVARLCEAIVDGLQLDLLAFDSSIQTDGLWAELQRALRRRYLPGTSHSAPAHRRLNPEIPVSVVLCTFDRPADLRNCLRCLVAQESPRPVEIIVVDNNPSSGRTTPVVAEFPEVQLVQEPRQGLAYARNKGITSSAGAIIVTTDDDVTMPPGWLESLVAPFAQADVMAVTGNILPLELETASQRLFERYGGLGRGFRRVEADAAWFAAFRRRAVPTWELGATANAAFRASIFGHPDIGLMDEALGPGMPSGVGEDTYLFYKVLKAGYQLVYQPDAYVWHKHRRDMPALRRQIYNYSKGHVAYHLTTLLRDHDLRALAHLLFAMPYWRVQQIISQLKAHLRSKNDYPLSLIWIEIRGNLAGPWALLRSRWRVHRQGRSEPYVPATQRSNMARHSRVEPRLGREPQPEHLEV